ncbi:MAG TPA: flavoprotein [Patescibacteria group bacterium]|nr:flavoprotein [Patescibacteria group bacterium]
MDTEQLVQLITSRVLEQLQGNAVKASADSVKPKILALFTGGTIGLIEGMAAVRELSATADISAVMSAAAETVIGVQRLRDSLGAQCPIITGKDPFPGKILRAADLVLVPVMTLNTAGKIALTLTDSLPSLLIIEALLMGKPVIAARNAADPHDIWRRELGMGHGNPALNQALQSHLQKLEGFGVTLTDVRQLTQAVVKQNGSRPLPAATGSFAAAPVKEKTARRFLSAEDVKSVALAGQKTMHLEKGTMVTPLAWDIAREYGVELCLPEV